MSVTGVTRSKARAQANYDRRSASYERFEGRFERDARLTGERLLHVEFGERVLEIGSGPGVSLAAFAQASGDAGHVVGLDISFGMLRVANRRLLRLRPPASVSLIAADAARVPLRTGSIDAAFACFTLELFDSPELPVVLGELRRLLRTGGRLAVVSLTLTDPPTLMERAYLLAHRLMPTLADCRPIPLEALVIDAGFEIAYRSRCDLFGLPVEALLALTTRA